MDKQAGIQQCIDLLGAIDDRRIEILDEDRTIVTRLVCEALCAQRSPEAQQGFAESLGVYLAFAADGSLLHPSRLPDALNAN